jgi:hypothetical protein
MAFWVNSGHAYLPPVAGRIPHSSQNSAMTRKSWYEDDQAQDRVQLLLAGGEDAERLDVLSTLDEEAQEQLAELLADDGVSDSDRRLLALLR